MPPFNEAETRAKLIDPILRGKGWFEHIKLEQAAAPIDIIGGRGRRRGKGRIDYLLRIALPGHEQPLPLALIEAKAETADACNGLEQAKDYADMLARRYHIPFVYACNGHLFVEYDRHSGLTSAPRPLAEFPLPEELRARYEQALGIQLDHPSSHPLLAPYSHGEGRRRYYQDAALRAVLEKLAIAEQTRQAGRALLSLATGAGKTFIAVHLLKRIAAAGQLKRALFLCDRDELRTQALTAFSNEFGDDAREVKEVGERNHAENARIHIATYQTLGVDKEDGSAAFLTRHYPNLDHFSHIVIDECHRSAWGKWRLVLDRNPGAAQIGLTATPRQLLLPKRRNKLKEAEVDERLQADNVQHFGEAVYEYTLTQAQEDGYLAACEIIRREVSLDGEANQGEVDRVRVRALAPVDNRTGQTAAEQDLKDGYSPRNLDKELIVPERTQALCEDLFKLLLEHGDGGPEQKTIVFCARDDHADRVAVALNNLYAAWCRRHGQPRKHAYAFKCTADSQGGAVVPEFREMANSHFIATTVDLLTTGVDIPRLANVVFFRYVASPIVFYQMVGRGTRIDEESGKLMFRLYDYTNLIGLFGQTFITAPASGGGGGGGGDTVAPVLRTTAQVNVTVGVGGHYVLGSKNGVATPIPVDEYRARLRERVLAEAWSLSDFRRLWIETSQRQTLIDHIVAAELSPEQLRGLEGMADYDLFDVLGHAAYAMPARTRSGRETAFLAGNAPWLESLAPPPRAVIRAFASQFARGGTEALESERLGQTPDVKRAGGLNLLRPLGGARIVLQQTKERLFAV
ncbi:MAG: DEAD/DEAH box helicase family protein [Pseudomonadota bacterium]|nr:DEAD/DEAH box helicase family protein [Pseudomonadota bacterium]MDP1904608.1 DEAD/DEAH box helicase family protein [Pseudomonadota bacterium]MDP2353253.1 DEAD/DEAH box helicase family protein [Pseudomonadota bacterium]